jgi:hypothetical protein
VFAVRYLSLVALVVWLGGMVAELAHGQLPAAFPLTGVACGILIIISLVLMKFIGPPPRAFAVRAGLAFAMTLLAAYARTYPHSSAVVTPRTITTVNALLGFVLLAWYARE